MKTYTVYRVDHHTNRHEIIGKVVERRKEERKNNAEDIWTPLPELPKGGPWSEIKWCKWRLMNKFSMRSGKFSISGAALRPPPSPET